MLGRRGTLAAQVPGGGRVCRQCWELVLDVAVGEHFDFQGEYSVSCLPESLRHLAPILLEASGPMLRRMLDSIIYLCDRNLRNNHMLSEAGMLESCIQLFRKHEV